MTTFNTVSNPCQPEVSQTIKAKKISYTSDLLS